MKIHLTGRPGSVFAITRVTCDPQKAKNDLAVLWRYLAKRYLLNRENASPAAEGESLTLAKIKSAEAILLLGSNDLAPAVTAAKMYHSLARQNPDLVIVASGKGGHLTVPGRPFPDTEAEAYARQLERDNVPAAKILIEKESTNSGDNIILSRKKLAAAGREPKRLVIVQTPAAQLRANLVFEKQWPADWEWYASCPPRLPDISKMPPQIVAFHLAYALREIATTINYSFNPCYDYLTKRTVPDEIIELVLWHYRRIAPPAGEIPRRDFFQPDNLETMMNAFRQQFAALEKKWLDR